MSIEKEPQSRIASQSVSSLAGETMSPTICIESFMEPIQLAGAGGQGRNNFRDWLPEAGYANRLFRLLNLFQQSQAFRFEFRNGDLFHVAIRP